MIRIMAMTNMIASMRLYISLNALTNWASEVLLLLLATNNNAAHTALPNTNAAIVASKRRHLPDIVVMIDANHRLSYSLAKRLEGRANGICIPESDDSNGK
jgi:hypothetical protein